MTYVLAAGPAVKTGLLRELDRPGRIFAHITPNWFASVMGTGIVATAAATLPVGIPGLQDFATAVWIFAASALVLLTGAFATHWTLHRGNAKSYAAHHIYAHFYGAPAMALLTVGAGALLAGPRVLGHQAAVAVDATLWLLGTALGLVVSVWVPFTMITRGRRDGVVALPVWMMPVVPPMVSATTGALLLPHIGTGQLGLALLAGCYAMFGLSLSVGLLTMAMVYARMLHGGLPDVQAIPTVWITIGLIGQSITAANLLPAKATSVLAGEYAGVLAGLHTFGIAFGLVMGGLGAFVFTLAAALTVHAARRGLRFTLTWWSFTFPVGTCVTGAGALAAASGIGALSWLAVALYMLLVAAWAVVAAQTLRGSWSGRLFRG
ncbi:MAG: TDT family transporter [Actinobacteria bacterium]|nr:TDT family transporter [Actinomycetota bacterium]